jgi:hypothetical protein
MFWVEQVIFAAPNEEMYPVILEDLEAALVTLVVT